MNGFYCVEVFLFSDWETATTDTQCHIGREVNPRPYKNRWLVEFGAGSGSCADYLYGLDSGGKDAVAEFHA